MTDGLKFVIVGGFLLIAAALASGGLYTVHPIGLNRTIIFVLNRLTGAAWVCWPGSNWKCLPAGDAPPKTPPPNDWITPPSPPGNPFNQFDTPSKAH